MPRPSNNHRVQDMYWFAHGGIETTDHVVVREGTPGPGDTEDELSESGSLPPKAANQDRAEEALPVIKSTDRQESMPKGNSTTKRLAVEERRRQLLEAEQEKNEAILKKHADREAALEARRNAQRNNISFAFGTSLPPNMEFDIAPVQLQPTVHAQPSKSAANAVSQNAMSQSMMSQSMTSSMLSSGPRGRRKNDLTPTVPYERTPAASRSVTAATRKRSVSMSRLDQLALPRKPYVEAHKAGSTLGSSTSRKDPFASPKRPLSSASEKSHKSMPRAPLSVAPVVNRRPQTARKPRPVSIAGSVPDPKPQPAKNSASQRRSLIQSKKPEAAKASSPGEAKPSAGKRSTSETPKKDAAEKAKTSSPASSTKNSLTKSAAKLAASKQATPKTSPSRKLQTNKKKTAMLVATAKETTKDISEEVAKMSDVPSQSSLDEDSQSTDDRSSVKHIASEEEAKAALAEKRRFAREQAEKEAELERQRQEELEREEERRRQQEEEDQRKMEEEQLHLLEEHKKFEQEKLQKAIEEQERKDEEERTKRNEEARLKAEQEKKAKEEAEKQRIELEEKLRKEEEERAERKKRLEKIMSRTRGKSGTASPSGSLSGSDPPDSIENHPLSSDPSSLESNEQFQAMDQSSPNESFDINQTLLLASQSLSSNDLMLPSSQHTSLDGSIQAFASEPSSLDAPKDVAADSIDGKQLLNQTNSLVVEESVKASVGFDVLAVEQEKLTEVRGEIEESSAIRGFDDYGASIAHESQVINGAIEEFKNENIHAKDSSEVSALEVSESQIHEESTLMSSNTQLVEGNAEMVDNHQLDFGIVQGIDSSIADFGTTDKIESQLIQPTVDAALVPEIYQEDHVNGFSGQEMIQSFIQSDFTQSVIQTESFEEHVVDDGLKFSPEDGNVDAVQQLASPPAFASDFANVSVPTDTNLFAVQQTGSIFFDNSIDFQSNPFGDYNQAVQSSSTENPFHSGIPTENAVPSEMNSSIFVDFDKQVPPVVDLFTGGESRGDFTKETGFQVDHLLNSGGADMTQPDVASVFQVTSDFSTVSEELGSGFEKFTPPVCDQTLNPFNTSMSVNSRRINSAIDFIAEESEESSLDSNLSQVLNVNTSGVSAFEDSEVHHKFGGLPNGQFYAADLPYEQNAFCDTEEVPQSNGCNGGAFVDRSGSVNRETDQDICSSTKKHLISDNGNIGPNDFFHLDNGDLTNSNKVASNPFLGSSDANPLSTNLF